MQKPLTHTVSSGLNAAGVSTGRQSRLRLFAQRMNCNWFHALGQTVMKAGEPATAQAMREAFCPTRKLKTALLCHHPVGCGFLAWSLNWIQPIH
jgi:hypothetical protein